MKWSARPLFPGQKAKSLAKDVSQMVKATQSWWLGYKFLGCLNEKWQQWRAILPSKLFHHAQSRAP